jgi:hypothetical protein
MTAFSIPAVVTVRLRLRALRAGDLDADAVVQANPEVMRRWPRSWLTLAAAPVRGVRCAREGGGVG